MPAAEVVNLVSEGDEMAASYEGGVGADGEICVKTHCKVKPYSVSAQAEILKIAGDHREPTHGGARGFGHASTHAYSLGWTR